MNNLVAWEGDRGKTIAEQFEKAKARIDDCDGVVILMQKKQGGILWFAPNNMTLETIIFYLWTVLRNIGK